MWLLLALLGHILNAFVFLSDKAFVEKLLPNPKALAFIGGAGSALALVLAPWFLEGSSGDVIAAAVLGGGIFVAGLLAFYLALDREEVSRVVPTVGGITPLFTLGFSMLILQEGFKQEFLWAFILLVAGGFLIEFRSFLDLISRRFRITFSWEIAAACFFALAFVLQKYAFEGTGDLSAFLWSRVGAVLFALPLLGFSSVRDALNFSQWENVGLRLGGLYVGSRVLAGVAPLLILAAIALGNVAIVNALQGAQYAFLFILAVMFSQRWPSVFGEALGGEVLTRKAIAVTLIGAGIFLLV